MSLSVSDFLMSQPLNVTIGESVARQRNENVRRRIEVPKYRIAKLRRQTLKPTFQPKPHVRKSGEKGRSGRKMVQDELTQVEREVAFIFLGLINYVLERAIKAAPRLHKYLLETGCRPGGSDTFVAQKVPSSRDERRVVMKLNAIKDVEHELRGELVDGQSVERLELQPGLKTFLNRSSCCVLLPLKRRVRHLALREAEISERDLAKCVRRGTRRELLV